VDDTKFCVDSTVYAVGDDVVGDRWIGELDNQAFQPSTSAAYSLVVNPDPTATVLAATPNPAIIGETVTLVASVSAAIASAGCVTFYDGTTPIGIAALDNTGTATLTRSSLALGSHLLSAAFAGSAKLLPSTAGVSSKIQTMDKNRTKITSLL
jgi:hypothetical protein